MAIRLVDCARRLGAPPLHPFDKPLREFEFTVARCLYASYVNPAAGKNAGIYTTPWREFYISSCILGCTRLSGSVHATALSSPLLFALFAGAVCFLRAPIPDYPTPI